MYPSTLHRIFRISRSMGGDNDLAFVFRSLKGRCYGIQFLAESVKLAYPTFIHRTIAFQNGLKDHDADVKRLHGKDSCRPTSSRNLISIRPVTQRIDEARIICSLQEVWTSTRVCFAAGRYREEGQHTLPGREATMWAFSRISTPCSIKSGPLCIF